MPPGGPAWLLAADGGDQIVEREIVRRDLGGIRDHLVCGVTLPPDVDAGHVGNLLDVGYDPTVLRSATAGRRSIFEEVRPIVTTTASEGSRIASVGGCSVVGRLCSGLG